MEPAPTPVRRDPEDARDFHVTLIRPPMVSPVAGLNISAVTPPLALACLSAALRAAAIPVTNIDAIGEALEQTYVLPRNPALQALGLRPEEIVARIPRRTRLIGVSCMFSLEWPQCRDLLQLIKAAFPDVMLIGGGEHLTAMPDFCLETCPELDLIVLGEGERTLLELIRRLGVGERLDGLPVKARAVESGAVRSTSNGASGQRIRELDELPWPAWDLTPIRAYLDKRLSFGRYAGITMPIMGSRGCPYECTFCSNALMWGRRYLTRSAADVVSEIVHYQEIYGIESVEFYDLTPIVRKSWIIEFCDQLIARGVTIKWQISGGTRCEAIDVEVIVKAKQAGCMYLCFAAESGSKAVLQRIRKRIDLDRMLWLIRLCIRHGLQTRCNLIIGFPDETRREMLRTLGLSLRLALAGVVDAPIFEFSPYPGSRLFDELREAGVIERLDDAYFESLGFNLHLRGRRRYCRAVAPREIKLYRLGGMIVFYAIYYLLRPRKVVGFIRNIFDYRSSNSVFEQRIIQNIKLKLKGAL